MQRNSGSRLHVTRLASSLRRVWYVIGGLRPRVSPCVSSWYTRTYATSMSIGFHLPLLSKFSGCVRPSAMCERSMPLRTRATLKVRNIGISGIVMGRSWPDR